MLLLANLQVLDLTGSRDFLDAETARQVLAPLLAAGAAHKHVSNGQVDMLPDFLACASE